MKCSQILVTGATGFVGRRLLQALINKKYKIRVLSRNPHPQLDTIICDLEQDQIPFCALESIDTVFYLAGYAHDLKKDTSKVVQVYYAVNVAATIQLAKLAKQQGVQSFVFVSSVKAGGSSATGSCSTEENQGEPEGIYGKTKREAEQKLLEIGLNSKMRVSIVRPSLVYGPCMKGNLNLMLSGIEAGWFPPLPKFENRRSLIHVDDLVRVLMLVANDEKADGEIFIATDGHAYSSREIYETMCHVLGKSVPKWSIPKFLFDIGGLVNPRLRYKIDKLMRDEHYSSNKLQSFGFQPQRTLIEMNETAF